MTALLELVVFLAPPLRPDADRPCALRLAGAVDTVEPMYIRYPSTAGGPYVLGRVEQHIVYLPCLWGILHRLAHIAAGLWGCGVGEHYPSCITGGVNCSNYYVWQTNFVQNREGNCATFCGCWRGRTVYRTSLTIPSPSVRFTELSDDNSVVAKFATTAADGKILQN